MSQILLSEMNRAARIELQLQEKYAESVSEVISARQQDNSKIKLILPLVGVSVLGVGLLVLVWFSAGFVAAVNFFPFWITLAAVLICTTFCGLLIYRQVSTMKYFQTIISAHEEVERVRNELHTRIEALPDKLTTALDSSENKWKMQINLPEKNVVEHLKALEMQVVSKAELKSVRINKIIVVFFYLAVTAYGLFGCVACYSIFCTLINSTGVPELAFGAAGLASVAGFIGQYWPASLFVKAKNGILSWWAPVILLSGVVASWAVALAITVLVLLCFLIVSIVLVIVQIVIGIIIVGIALAVIVGLIGALFGS